MPYLWFEKLLRETVYTEAQFWYLPLQVSNATLWARGRFMLVISPNTQYVDILRTLSCHRAQKVQPLLPNSKFSLLFMPSLHYLSRIGNYHLRAMRLGKRMKIDFNWLFKTTGTFLLDRRPNLNIGSNSESQYVSLNSRHLDTHTKIEIIPHTSHPTYKTYA